MVKLPDQKIKESPRDIHNGKPEEIPEELPKITLNVTMAEEEHRDAANVTQEKPNSPVRRTFTNSLAPQKNLAFDAVSQQFDERPR